MGPRTYDVFGHAEPEGAVDAAAEHTVGALLFSPGLHAWVRLLPHHVQQPPQRAAPRQPEGTGQTGLLRRQPPRGP